MSQKRTTSFRTNVWRSIISRPHQETPPIRLKAALTRNLVLPILVLASLAAAPVAAGVISSHPAAICKSAKDANLFATVLARNDGKPGGITDVGTGVAEIVCPLPRRTINTNGAHVYVDVYHVGQPISLLRRGPYAPPCNHLRSREAAHHQ